MNNYILDRLEDIDKRASNCIEKFNKIKNTNIHFYRNNYEKLHEKLLCAYSYGKCTHGKICSTIIMDILDDCEYVLEKE